MVVPQALVRTVERLAQNFYISPTAVSQVGALAAFDAVEELEANRAVYAANRALLLEELPRAGFAKLAPADGAFYLYADVSRFTPDSAAFEDPDTGPWLKKYYSVNQYWTAEDRRKLLHFARDLLNSDYASHRLTFALFAQSPPFAHLNAVYMNFPFKEALEFAHDAAGLSDTVLQQR